MARFEIKKIDPIVYKSIILNFWDDYLPGTVHSRLEWMEQGNPAGPAQWFFAFDNLKNEIAGMISVIPRIFLYNQKTYRAGMLGDYMIGKSYRVFGPAIQLQKFLISNLEDLGYDFLYTIPASDLLKFFDGLGYKRLSTLKHYVLPLNIAPYLEKRLNPILNAIVTPVSNCFLSIVTMWYSQSTMNMKNLGCEEDLTASIPENQLIGERTPQYLSWRYSANPAYHFKTNLFYGCSKDQLIGYLSYAVESYGIEIFDLYSSSPDAPIGILKNFIRYARHLKTNAVYFRISSESGISQRLNKHLFRDMQDDVHVLYYSGKGLNFNNGYFTWGEKII